jgi:hypothetical protein
MVPLNPASLVMSIRLGSQIEKKIFTLKMELCTVTLSQNNLKIFKITMTNMTTMMMMMMMRPPLSLRSNDPVQDKASSHHHHR